MRLIGTEQTVRPIRTVMNARRLIHMQIAGNRGEITERLPVQAGGGAQGITHQITGREPEMTHQIFHVFHVVLEHIRLIETDSGGTTGTPQIRQIELEFPRIRQHKR